MPVEPWIFISYGRPEKKLAHAISSLMWSKKIETYNYIYGSVVERDFESKGLTYPIMQHIAKLWIIILTPRSLRPDNFFPAFRQAVLDEIVRMRAGGTPLICLSNDKIMREAR
jgi:hypothetical protein